MFLTSAGQFVTPAGRNASRFIEAGTLLLTNSGATLGVSNQGAAQPNLNASIVRNITVPVCSVDEMIKIISVIEVQMSRYVKQRASIEQGLVQAAAQRQNILKAAFSGRLVPQDPSDEPASVLLERICAERAARLAKAAARQRKPKAAA